MSEEAKHRLLAQAAVLHLGGQRQQALDLLKQAAATGEAFAELYAAMGLLHYELEQYEPALDCYAKALHLQPRQPQPRLNQAVCLDRLGRSEEALAAYEDVLENDPGHLEARLGLGSCLLRLNRPEQALAAFERCLEQAPAHSDALLGKAAALRLARQAVSLAPRRAPRLPYPHRSIRSIRLTGAQLYGGLAISLAISAALLANAFTLLDLHSRICVRLLGLAGITVQGREAFQVFSPFAATWAPIVSFLPFAGHERLLAGLLALSAGALLLVYRRVMLARNFLLFLLTLLVLPAAFVLLGGQFTFSSTSFTQIWMRFELVIWVLLPWVSAFRFFPVQPSPLKAAGSIVAVQGFGFLWSASRLAFCLGLFHYTGVVFLPLIWFCLGLLGDVLYVIVFYSVAVHRACIALWRERAACQH